MSAHPANFQYFWTEIGLCFPVTPWNLILPHPLVLRCSAIIFIWSEIPLDPESNCRPRHAGWRSMYFQIYCCHPQVTLLFWLLVGLILFSDVFWFSICPNITSLCYALWKQIMPFATANFLIQFDYLFAQTFHLWLVNFWTLDLDYINAWDDPTPDSAKVAMVTITHIFSWVPLSRV